MQFLELTSLAVGGLAALALVVILCKRCYRRCRRGGGTYNYERVCHELDREELDFKRALERLDFDLDREVVDGFCEGDAVKYGKFLKLCGGDDDDDDDNVDGVLKKLRKESRALRRSLEGDISERKLRNAADDAGGAEGLVDELAVDEVDGEGL